MANSTSNLKSPGRQSALPPKTSRLAIVAAGFGLLTFICATQVVVVGFTRGEEYFLIAMILAGITLLLSLIGFLHVKRSQQLFKGSGLALGGGGLAIFAILCSGLLTPAV